jgi:hypothetical protein
MWGWRVLGIMETTELYFHLVSALFPCGYYIFICLFYFTAANIYRTLLKGKALS